MPVTDIHLRTFLDRLDVIRENLHLRPLTDREKEELALIAGFSTTTSGVYNPIFSKPKWKNVKAKPYTEEKFKFHNIVSLTTIGNKNYNKKVRLSTIKQTSPLQIVEHIEVLKNISDEKITTLDVIKQCLPRKKTQKLRILQKFLGNITNPLIINKSVDVVINTPLAVNIWGKVIKTFKLKVLSKLKSNLTTSINERIYITDDVGTISDIELLDIIKEVEMIDAIRY